MRETLRHQEAFNYYYSLGEKRSIPQVAQRYTVSVAAVKKWSRAFNWQERVEQRDIENSRCMEEKVNETIVATKANYRKIIKVAIARWVQKFKVHEIDPDSVPDLERLVKLDLLLMGEATEREEYVPIDYRQRLLDRIASLAARRQVEISDSESQSEGS